jgi:hypothetical protein
MSRVECQPARFARRFPSLPPGSHGKLTTFPCSRAANTGAGVTVRSKRLLGVAILCAGLGLGGVAVTVCLTWPNNALGVYLHERENRQANIRALEWRVGAETDSTSRAFYQAWLAEEKGDIDEAIRGFQSLRDAARPGTRFHLRASIRLGLAYGLNREPERELATYRALIDQYPGPSRLSQANFYLRHGEKEKARETLDEALAQDANDGSLGSDRQFAQGLRSGLGPGRREGSSAAP